MAGACPPARRRPSSSPPSSMQDPLPLSLSNLRFHSFSRSPRAGWATMTAVVLRAAVTGARHGGCRPTPSLPLSRPPPSLPPSLPLAWYLLQNPICHLSAFPSVHAIHISLPCLMLHIFLMLWLTLRSNEIRFRDAGSSL
ncbi:hypothetical protein BDA96_05G178000 [Sorghum bicolor]|uniref:Uncharacterized protein n=1 Tax=Sorghum bicolor TaxID=4558 RepID=A0A921R0F6_SORBI|nr:hypothetical protein BDA96_05G178000 [Sorghum bicolor]